MSEVPPDLAGILEYPLVRPELTSAQVLEGLTLAKRLGVVCAVARPCDMELAARTLEGSGVLPGAVAGYPHGSQTTAVKLYEIRDLLRRGAKAIDAVIALPRLLSREFQHVQTELDQMAEACRGEGAALTVIFETAYLTDELKIVACRSCARAGVHFASTSTEFAPAGCTARDVALLRKYLPEEIGVKGAGAVQTLDQALEAMEAGAARISTTAPVEILAEWKARQAAAARPAT